MQAQATTAPAVQKKLPKMRVMSAAHVEVLETLMNAYHGLKSAEQQLHDFDATKDSRRAALQQLADERYANFVDAIDAAEAAGAVLP